MSSKHIEVDVRKWYYITTNVLNVACLFWCGCRGARTPFGDSRGEPEEAANGGTRSIGQFEEKKRRKVYRLQSNLSTMGIRVSLRVNQIQ